MLEEIEECLVCLNHINRNLLTVIFYLIELCRVCVIWRIWVYNVDFTFIRDKRLELDISLHHLLNVFCCNIFHNIFLATVMSAQYFVIFYIEQNSTDLWKRIRVKTLFVYWFPVHFLISTCKSYEICVPNKINSHFTINLSFDPFWLYLCPISLP